MTDNEPTKLGKPQGRFLQRFFASIKAALGSRDAWTSSANPGTADWVRLLAATVLCTVWSYRRLLSADSLFVGNDADLPQNWIPRFRFVRLWQQAGETPYWDPFAGLGRSLVGEPDGPHALLPLLQRLFTSDKSLDLTIMLLIVLMACGSVCLLTQLGHRRITAVLGATLFASTGMYLTQLYSGHLPLFACLSLSPLLLSTLLFGLQRAPIHSLAPASLTWAACLACRSPQGAYLTGWLACSFLFLRFAFGLTGDCPLPSILSEARSKRHLQEGNPSLQPTARTRLLAAVGIVLKLALVFLLGAEIASCAWLPLLETTDALGKHRDIMAHTAPGISWLSLLLPQIFLGTGQEYNWTSFPTWEGQVGMSTACLPLILLGFCLKPNRTWLPALLLLAGAAVLALGNVTPGYSIYTYLDPLISAFEVPSRFYFIVNFALCLLFCQSLEVLFVLDWTLSKRCKTGLLIAAGALACAWTATYYSDGANPFWVAFQERVQNGYQYVVENRRSGLEYYVIFWMRYTAATALLLCLIYALVRLPRPYRAAAVCLFLLMDVTRSPHPYMNLRSLDEFSLPPNLAKILTETQRSVRTSNLMGKWNGVCDNQRIPDWSFHLPAGQEEQLQSLAGHVQQEERSRTELFPGPNSFYRALGIRSYIHPKGLLKEQEWQHRCKGLQNMSEEGDDWSVTLDPAGQTPVYLSRAFSSTAQPRKMLQTWFEQPSSIESGIVFVEPGVHDQLSRILQERGPDQPSANPAAQGEKVEVGVKIPGLVQLKTQLQSTALVVLNEAWSPDWHVEVDGAPELCVPCQLGLNRGVLVGGGQHLVEFSYKPPSVLRQLRESWIALILTALGSAALWGLSRLIRALR